jgi:HSF-type DNA-binding
MSATPSVAPDGPEYRDFSMEESRGGGVNRTMDCFTVRDGNFPTKLHPMLSAAEANGMSDIVGFRPQGRCFMVYKPKEFVDKVLSRYVVEV